MEAAWILPFSVGVLLLLVMAAMFYRDVTVANAWLLQEAEQAAGFWEYGVYPGTDTVLYEDLLERGYLERFFGHTGSLQKACLQTHLEEGREGRFWVAEVTDAVLSERGGKLYYTVQLTLPVLGEGILFGWKPDWFFAELSAEVPQREHCQWARMAAVILHTGEQVPGFDKVTKILREFLAVLGK